MTPAAERTGLKQDDFITDSSWFEREHIHLNKAPLFYQADLFVLQRQLFVQTHVDQSNLSKLGSKSMCGLGTLNNIIKCRFQAYS